jgi:signal transduction histidine kinase
VRRVISEDSNKILISVRDTGVGIKPEDTSKIFTLFGRLEMANNFSDDMNGVGLGLTISEKLVRSLSTSAIEKLNVQSVFGEGSEFYFAIPLVTSKK